MTIDNNLMAFICGSVYLVLCITLAVLHKPFDENDFK